MKLFFYPILTFGLLLVSCSDDSIESSSFNASINLNMDNFNNIQTVIESPAAHSGKMICHLDSANHYGFFYSFSLPDSLVGKGIKVSIDSWVKTGNKENKCSIICSVTNNRDSILTWQAIDASSVISEANHWANLKGDFNLNETILVYGSKINIMCFNNDAISYFDVDDLYITYSETKTYD